MLRELNPSFRKQFILCCCSALLLILSFPWVECWLLGWCAFIPFFFALEGASGRRAFLLGYLTGVFFWLGSIYWLIHVTLPGLLLLVAYLSLFFGLFALLISRRAFTPRRALLAAPALWVVLEFARSHLLTGFGWVKLGYSQYRVPIAIQIADLAGVWGVSFLVMTVNVCLYALLRRGRAPLPKGAFIAALLFISGALCYGAARCAAGAQPASATARVALIQPNIAQALKWDPRARPYILETYFRLSEKALEQKPDLVIWPEAAFPGVVGEDDDLFLLIQDFIAGLHTPVLMGAVTFDGKNYYNSALLIGASGARQQAYHKMHLVPFGEYIPLRRMFPFLESIAPIGDITPGTSQTLFSIQDREGRVASRYGVLICFEDLFPELAAASAARGADLLVNLTNDAWYMRSPAAKQHFIASVFRALENRRFLLRVTNTGVTGAIAADGSVVTLVEDSSGREIFIAGVAFCDIPLGTSGQTVFTRYPFGFIFVSLLILLLYGVGLLFRLAPCARSRQ